MYWYNHWIIKISKMYTLVPEVCISQECGMMRETGKQRVYVIHFRDPPKWRISGGSDGKESACSAGHLGLSSGSDPLKLVCHRAPSCLDSVQSHGFQHYQWVPSTSLQTHRGMSSCLRDITTWCPSQPESPKWSLSYPTPLPSFPLAHPVAGDA